MLENLYLRADDYYHERREIDGQPAWDLNVLNTDQAAILFATHLGYHPDRKKWLFVWDGPRAVDVRFPLPAYLGPPKDVFCVDADGVHEVEWQFLGYAGNLRDTVDRVGVYVVDRGTDLRTKITERRNALVAEEAALGFDPIGSDADFETLEKDLRHKR